ncbi:hypothetical protein [Psychroflexus tropicus]|uniref:hypothetical protein n=1 Tax=Psychroflexus tropicus TaxID=197345 RepID=UPI000364A871|nr:hypothetical protein [Psychroflexus tropicus]
MEKLIKLFLLSTVLWLTSCDKNEKKIVDLNNGKNQLTILRFDDGKYLINGRYNSDGKPNVDYLKSDVFYEYHSGLAKWTENRIEIFSHYGNFDTINSNGKFKVFEVTTKEFEELKKDSVQYTYFYY